MAKAENDLQEQLSQSFADEAASEDTTPKDAEENVRSATLDNFEAAPGQPSGAADSGKSRGLELILDVEVPVSAELGRTQMPIGQILELGPGSIVELDKMASDPVDLFVNNKLIARGEVVVVDENFGIRITSVVDPRQRVKSLA